TSDKVDLLMGPYATGAILSAMGVAQRYNKVLVHHTFGIPSLAKYECQFPAWSLGPVPEISVPNTLFNALDALPKPPKTIAVVTSKFPSVHFMSLGARELAKKRGLTEVLFLEWDFGNLDYGPIAARVKDAKPDFVWVDAIQGKLRFNGPSNYGDDLMKVKQVQDGHWVTVFPKEGAAPGASLRVQ